MQTLVVMAHIYLSALENLIEPRVKIRITVRSNRFPFLIPISSHLHINSKMAATN